MSRQYYIYILSNKTHTALYIGVTNNLIRRVWQHKQKQIPGFTSKYNIEKLVYFEVYSDINEAILREKQLKAGSRTTKITLIESSNSKWVDLYERILE